MALATPIQEKLFCFFSENIAPIIWAETQKLLSVPKLVDDIQNEMKVAKDFLIKEAEEKADGADDQTKKQVTKLRELIFRIEDIIDDYNLLGQQLQQLSSQQQEDGDNGCMVGIRELLHGGSTKVASFKKKYRIASEIVRINKEIEKIKGDDGKKYEESITFSLVEESDSSEQGSDVEEERDPGFFPLYKDEEELVGFKDRKMEVIKKLDLDKKKYCKGQFVLAVWGEPGVGKTTLARKVYEDEDVRKNFGCYAWITATKPYKRVDLIKCLFKQFVSSTSSAAAAGNEGLLAGISVQDVEKLQDNEAILTDRLRNYFQQSQNRYLVVLDNVSEMEELSKVIKAALVPSHSEGGRILMTTKSEGIANYWKTSSSHGETYSLQVLSEKEAKVLFNKKAFGNQGQCPWKLESLRDKIVQECDGLPILIEKVGATFSTTDKWIELYHDFQVNPLSPMSERHLLSSYYDMPLHLKPCFLYLCMFPKGYELDRMRIVRLWIAEDFVEAKGHSTPEDAAEEYLNELVERGMVRLSKTEESRDETGRNRKFRLPNMWRHIMHRKLADLSFCQVLPKTMFSTNNGCRRLSIHNDIEDTHVIARSVRSILTFSEARNVSTTRPERFPIPWPLPFKEATFWLKVLDLQNADFTVLPETIGNLHNLRYLCLRNTKVKKLPESISGLWNLQTLDLKQTMVEELPREINRLHKLRHLLICRYEDTNTVPVKIHEGVVLGSFNELQKLAFVDGSPAHVVHGLTVLTQLKRLAIVNLGESHGETFCEALDNLKMLRSLSILNEEDQVLDLSHVKYPPEFLERLYLKGQLRGRDLPIWVAKLKHLVRVRLSNSGLAKDPLAKLKVMQELLVLELDNTYGGEKLDFGNKTFGKLRVLHIRNFHNLSTIKAEVKALPELQKAKFQHCSKLKNISQFPPHICPPKVNVSIVN